MAWGCEDTIAAATGSGRIVQYLVGQFGIKRPIRLRQRTRCTNNDVSSSPEEWALLVKGKRQPYHESTSQCRIFDPLSWSVIVLPASQASTQKKIWRIASPKGRVVVVDGLSTHT